MKEEGVFSPFRYPNVIEISRDNFENTHDFRRHLATQEEPVIILTTSGMMEPSPLHTHLRFAANKPENLLAVVGYQAEGTRGRDLMEGKRTIKLSVDWNNEVDVNVKMKIKRFHFSGHTSVDGIHDLIKAVKPKQIYLIHGDVEEQQDVIKRVSNGVIPVTLRPQQTQVLASK